MKSNKEIKKKLYLVSSFAEAPILLDKLKGQDSYIIVIFDSYDLYKLLIELNFDSSNIHYVEKVNQSSRKPLTYFKARKYYLSKLIELKSICNDVIEVHCFHIFGNLFCFQLANKILNNVNSIYIYECIKFDKVIAISQYPQWLVRSLLVKFLYGRGSQITVTPHKYLESFDMNKYGDAKKIISFEKCQKIRKYSPISNIYCHEHKFTHIFFDQPIVNYGRTSEKDYYEFIESIKKTYSNEISNNKFCIKLHPGNHSDLRFYKGLKILPSYIPSECLKVNEETTWVAISSSTLWIRNQAKKIALINLVKFKSDKIKNYIKDSIVMNFDKEVSVPLDFTDLQKISQIIK